MSRGFGRFPVPPPPLVLGFTCRLLTGDPLRVVGRSGCFTFPAGALRFVCHGDHSDMTGRCHVGGDSRQQSRPRVLSEHRRVLVLSRDGSLLVDLAGLEPAPPAIRCAARLAPQAREKPQGSRTPAYLTCASYGLASGSGRVSQCGEQGSNLPSPKRPDLQSGVHTRWTFAAWRRVRDSNPRALARQPLSGRCPRPAGHPPHVGMRGFEPPMSCSQSRWPSRWPTSR